MTIGAAITAAMIAVASPSTQEARVAEVAIEAKGPIGPLSGTMLAPRDGAPVVLIIPGSGPTDRDGNNPMGVKAGYLKLLAQGLAEKGVGSVRIDKRGMFGSKGAVAADGEVRIADYVTDVGSWVQAVRNRTGVDCVWLAGHSEGALVALAAAQAQQHLCGVVLIASPGRPMITLMREQFQKNPGNAPILPDVLPVLDAMERGEVADTSKMDTRVAPIFSPVNQRYLIDANRYDPAKLAATYRGPLLIVQGERDLQTTMDDANAIAAARADATLKLLPEMNHVLKVVPADNPVVNMMSYSHPDLPLAPGLVDAVAAFVTQ